MIRKRIEIEPEIEITQDELLAEIRSRNCLDQVYCLRELGKSISDGRLRDLRTMVGSEAWREMLTDMDAFVMRLRNTV